MTLSMLIPMAAFAAAAGARTRKWIYIPLVILAIPAPAVATVVGAIALAWLARHYAASASTIATTVLAGLALVGWFVGTGATLQGYGLFALLWILAGLAVTAATFIRATAKATNSATAQQSANDLVPA
ncbi:hypothetical protein [Prescottella agglutinans]|uniref:Integral membrane protein n=1 Tax=Prescottella agglutinans TaxID=1644129 RepID=A0ABT6MKS8_9NOCA|nr:hypothetical protein [Prescottella agglutinans]MDH6283944.1 hypothetical protein [Prescottella agglutinans]